jgi:hypothetical protein
MNVLNKILTASLALTLCAAFSSNAFAQTKKTVVTTTTTTDTPTSTNRQSTDTHTYTAPTDYRPMYSADLGLGSVGNFTFGAGFRADIPVTLDENNFTFGGQTGFYYVPSHTDAANISTKGWVIPILATALYHFKTSNSLKPYIGIAMGIDIAHGSYSGSNSVAPLAGNSNTNVDFAFLVKPGFDFGMGSQYYFEVPFGTMASNFTIIPSIGMHF